MPKRSVMRRFPKWLNKLLPKPRTYVIVYDHDCEDDPIEEYYGYFASPEEARSVWNVFNSDEIIRRNVRLCRVVEEW